MSALYYVVTYLPANRSEPVEERVSVETGDPDVDADRIIDDFHFTQGAEVLHIRWSTGGTVWHDRGIDS